MKHFSVLLHTILVDSLLLFKAIFPLTERSLETNEILDCVMQRLSPSEAGGCFPDEFLEIKNRAKGKRTRDLNLR